MTSNAKLIAFYRVQRHAAVGGDSDWEKVLSAQPFFAGHHQPQVPTDQTLCDSRSTDTRVKQASLAKQYGIYGFCYFHPVQPGRHEADVLEDVLNTGKPDMPFCLCLDGAAGGISAQDSRTEADDVALARKLQPFFEDKRYIKVQGRPMLLVSCPERFPDMNRSAAIWRAAWRTAGIEVFVVGLEQSGELVPQLSLIHI
jgi:hypothetical protein